MPTVVPPLNRSTDRSGVCLLGAGDRAAADVAAVADVEADDGEDDKAGDEN